MPESRNILLVGCGKMGGAMLRGWLARGIDSADVRVVEPSMLPRKRCAASFQCRSYPPPLTSIPVSRPTSWYLPLSRRGWTISSPPMPGV